MTIFTTNPFDDGYFVDGKPVSKFQQFCMRSWERMGKKKFLTTNLPKLSKQKKNVRNGLKML